MVSMVEEVVGLRILAQDMVTYGECDGEVFTKVINFSIGFSVIT